MSQVGKAEFEPDPAIVEIDLNRAYLLNIYVLPQPIEPHKRKVFFFQVDKYQSRYSLIRYNKQDNATMGRRNRPNAALSFRLVSFVLSAANMPKFTKLLSQPRSYQ